MLDKQTEMMLQVASTLTAEDLEFLRSGVSADRTKVEACPSAPSLEPKPQPTKSAAAGTQRGDRERQRTRESKVSTSCLGSERAKHDWWPVGTELEGRIGSELFTATVVENSRVKSNRSLLIASGQAQGSLCITPTRAALEATEHFRQTYGLGRVGGVTNGWTFWKPKSQTQ